MNHTSYSGLVSTEILNAVHSILPTQGELQTDGETLADPEETVAARLMWSRIIEPGDAVAGMIIAALGPIRALAAVYEATLGTVHTLSEILAAAHKTELSLAQLRAAVRRWGSRIHSARIDTDCAVAAACGAQLLTPEHSLWPSALHDLGFHAPILLWVRGEPSLLSATSLAIVGARACSGYGTHITAEFSDEACSLGAVVLSGAAYGVDAVAHRAALAREHPTIAVLAGGIDRPYPSGHRELISAIAHHGAVCAETPPGSAPTRWRFLQRNRNIAALASATLVTEAGNRSGSLNTAGHAAELSRAVGAVPGPITSNTSQGCHTLIRDYGAMLVTRREDLAELFGVSQHRGEHSDEAATEHNGDRSSGAIRMPATHQRLLDALPLRGGKTTTELVKVSGMSYDEVRRACAELALLGNIAQRETATTPIWVLQRRE